MSPGASVRFRFGKNWQRYAAHLDEDRVAVACASLRSLSGREDLSGLRVLDVGTGSGLFSLAAVRLGAAEVVSFDYDEDSVACASALHVAEGSPAHWRLARGDVLDAAFMSELGEWDLVYAWGVLHHTGAMWRAVDHCAERVAEGGQLLLALYNDQGLASRMWRGVKRGYNRLPETLRAPYVVCVMGPRELAFLGWCLARGRPGVFYDAWAGYRRRRGMSRWHDMVDWVGGYPFEVAAPGAVVERLRGRGFVLDKLATVGGRLGCNEFAFSRPAGATRPSSSESSPPA